MSSLSLRAAGLGSIVECIFLFGLTCLRLEFDRLGCTFGSGSAASASASTGSKTSASSTTGNTSRLCRSPVLNSCITSSAASVSSSSVPPASFDSSPPSVTATESTVCSSTPSKRLAAATPSAIPPPFASRSTKRSTRDVLPARARRMATVCARVREDRSVTYDRLGEARQRSDRPKYACGPSAESPSVP